MAFLVHPLPPVAVYVKMEYLYDLEPGHPSWGNLTPGIWISVKSTQSKALYFETLLTDYGALYDKLPISAFVWKTEFNPDDHLPLDVLQLWDCFDYDITVIQKPILCRCEFFGKDKKMVAMFFNSIFLSIDDKPNDDDNMVYQIPDKSEPYNMQLLNIYLTGLLKKHLDDREYNVLRLSYGLDCDKHSAKEIATKLNIEGSSSYVRVSQLKKQAVDKLITNVDHSQVLDYL